VDVADMGWFLSAGFKDSHSLSPRGRLGHMGSAHQGVGVAAIDRGGSPEPPSGHGDRP